MLFSEKINTHYQPQEYPALDFVTQQFATKKPFAGKNVLVATPIFTNTLIQYRAILTGGANLFVGRSANMQSDSQTIDFLQENNIPIISNTDILQGKVADNFDVILDCAGQFSFCKPLFGVVELTRSGVQFYQNSLQPVFIADNGIIKQIETILGTGDGYIRGLAKFGYTNLLGKNLLVFGSGKVGTGIAFQAANKGMNVTVATDLNNVQFPDLLAQNCIPTISYTDEKAVEIAINHSDFLVTATGVKNALSQSANAAILANSHLVVANMGVEDEFGENLPKTRVLNNKNSLNFALNEPTHLKYIDASLALHTALGELLLNNPPFKGIANPPHYLEQQLLDITLQNGIIGKEISLVHNS